MCLGQRPQLVEQRVAPRQVILRLRMRRVLNRRSRKAFAKILDVRRSVE